MRLRETRAATFAPALPMPWPALANHGLRIRRGQTSLTVAAPGAGKSQFWANYAHRIGVPTAYWSADTDQTDVTSRTLAMWLGMGVAEVEDKLHDNYWRSWMFEQLGDRANHIEWVFDSSITGKHLGERLNAFAEVRGEYPHLVVLDNLSNAIANPADEYAEVKVVMGQVQVLARATNAHIAVLHHAKGIYDDGTKPIPQSGGIQNPFKTVEVGLTMHRPDEGRLAVNVVKNRGGKSDPGARFPVYMQVDFAQALVKT